MLFKNTFFKPIWGEFDSIGTYATTDFPITEADANSPTAATIPGKAVALDHAAMKIVYATGSMFGFMQRSVSLNGVMSDAWWITWTRRLSTAGLDPPIRRGLCAPVMVFRPSSLIELEGLGVASVDNNVITSGTGALSAGTTRNTELTVEKGGWRAAAIGELVFGFHDANLTPEVVGNLRFLLRTCVPYKKNA